jgi:pilus assembly protein CpaE
MKRMLHIVAVAGSEATRQALYQQLSALPFVMCDNFLLTFEEAATLCPEQKPDIILVDMTGRETDAGLFIEAMASKHDCPWSLFALHKEMDHRLILEAVRRGAKEFIHYPEDKSSLEESLKRHLQHLEKKLAASLPKESSEKKQGKLVTLFSSKGGAGCSTVAINLTHELLQLTRKSVVYLDMDQIFNNTAVMLNVRPNFALRDLAENRADDVDDTLLQKIIVSHESGFDMVVGSKNVLDETEMVSPELLDKVLNYLLSHYEYVVVDLPTHVLDPYHQYLVERSNQVLIVSGMDIPCLYRTRQYLDLARQYLSEDKLMLVLNRVTLKSAVGISNQDLEAQFRYPVYCRLVNDWDLMVESYSLGRLLSSVSPKAELVKCLQKLARLVAGLEQPQEQVQKESGKMGVLQRLMNNNMSKTSLVKESS